MEFERAPENIRDYIEKHADLFSTGLCVYTGMREDLKTIGKIFGGHLQTNLLTVMGIDLAYYENDWSTGLKQIKFGGFHLFNDSEETLGLTNVPDILRSGELIDENGITFLHALLGDNLKLILTNQEGFEFDFEVPDQYFDREFSTVIMVGNQHAEDRHFVKGLTRLKKDGIIVADHHMPAIVPLEYLGLRPLRIDGDNSHEEIVAAVKTEEIDEEILLELMELDSELIDIFGLVQKGARWLNHDTDENYIKWYDTYIIIPDEDEKENFEAYRKYMDRFFSHEIDSQKIDRITSIINKYDVNIEELFSRLEQWFNFTDKVQEGLESSLYSYHTAFCMDVERESIRDMMTAHYPEERRFFEEAAAIGEIIKSETQMIMGGGETISSKKNRTKTNFLSKYPLRQKRNARRDMLVDEIKRQLAA
jgi:hypothetical protein